MEPVKVYKSGVDAWYYAIIFLVIGTLGYAYHAEGLTPDSPEFPVFAFSAVFSVGLMLWLLKSTDYTVTADTLVVRCGPIKWRIPLEDIHDITPSRSLLSSPALSLKRLAIRYGNNRRILVSPEDRSGFISALGFTRTPDL